MKKTLPTKYHNYRRRLQLSVTLGARKPRTNGYLRFVPCWLFAEDLIGTIRIVCITSHNTFVLTLFQIVYH